MSSTSAKYLGIIIDNKWKFEEQVNAVLRKMAHAIRTIQILRNHLPLNARIHLLESLVISHIKYSAPLLTSISQQSVNRLDRQLNWGLKTCFFSFKFDRVTPLKLASNVLGVKDQIAISILSKLWTILNLRAPAFQNLKLPTLVHSIHQRTQKILLGNHSRTNYMVNSFGSYSVKLWNQLPLSIRIIRSKYAFKKALKIHYCEQFKSLPLDRILNGWTDFNILF